MGSFGIFVLRAVGTGSGARQRAGFGREARLLGGDGHGDTFRFER